MALLFFFFVKTLIKIDELNFKDVSYCCTPSSYGRVWAEIFSNMLMSFPRFRLPQVTGTLNNSIAN